MQVGDYFKVAIPRHDDSEVIYEALIISSDAEWVSAKVVYPYNLAEKLKSEGVFKIHLGTIGVTILGNPESKPVLRAIYG